MPYAINLATHLVIDDIPLSTAAWEHLNIYALLGAAATRGENKVMPGAVGVRPLRHRPTETTQTLDLAIYGERNWEGTAYPDPKQGLVRNVAFLRSNVADPLLTPDSVRTASLVLPGETWTAAVQVLGFEITESIGPASVFASMDITIIGGAFHL